MLYSLKFSYLVAYNIDIIRSLRRNVDNMPTRMYTWMHGRLLCEYCFLTSISMSIVHGQSYPHFTMCVTQRNKVIFIYFYVLFN